MAFPIAEAQLTALFMQSIAYGVHFVTFATCIYTWFQRPGTLRTPNRWPWMIVAIVLFVVGTIDVCFNFYHNLVAFIFFTGAGGANAAFEDLSSWINVLRSVWYFLQALVSDAALICRCWIVYQRMLSVLLLPTLFWLTAAASAILQLYYMFELKQDVTIPDARKIQPFYHTFFATSLALNIFITASMTYRIWSIQKLSSEFFTRTWRGSGRANLSQLNRIFVESALLYTVSVAATLVTELVKSNGNYGTSDVSLELAGVSFDLIIIRIWTGISTETTALLEDTRQSVGIHRERAPTKSEDHFWTNSVEERTTSKIDIDIEDIVISGVE